MSKYKFEVSMTMGQYDVLLELLYEESQLGNVMNPAMARAIYEELHASNAIRKAKARLSKYREPAQ